MSSPHDSATIEGEAANIYVELRIALEIVREDRGSASPAEPVVIGPLEAPPPVAGELGFDSAVPVDSKQGVCRERR